MFQNPKYSHTNSVSYIYILLRDYTPNHQLHPSILTTNIQTNQQLRISQDAESNTT